MHAFSIRVALVVGLSSAGVAQDSGAGAADPPRYRLQVGQRLTFEGSLDADYGKQTRRDATTWQVWVTRQNDDGSWHLIVCAQTSSRWTHNGRADEGNSDDSTDWSWCDLYADGRIPPNDATRHGADVSVLFPRLPQNADEVARGWSTDDGRGSKRLFTPAKSDDAAAFAFDVRRQDDDDAIYLSTHEATCSFDRSRGLIAETTTRFSQGYGFVGKGTAKTVLKEVDASSAEELAALAADFDTSFSAMQAWSDKTEAAADDPVRMDALLGEAKDVLVAARATVTHPAAQKLLDDRIEGHDRQAGYQREAAERRAKVMDKPSPEWETTDLAGNPHSVKSHAGEVMVLDFWYRGCGWCIKAMPQVKQVAEHFRGKPVAVLSMNTDRKVEDAQFVVDKMGLTYPTLKATGIPEKYGVRGFPTLVIVDQHGVVRGWHVGYSIKLRDEVVAAVETLLAAGAK